MTLDPSTIELREVTQDNFDSVIGLQVAADQREFLNPNVEAIAWAYVAPEAVPLVVCSGETPVGFASYGYVPTDGRCWIIHFMIDERSQRQGIGRAALEELLARMDAVSGGRNIAVAVNPENAAAIRLYEAFGFVDTGRRQNDELILLRPGTSLQADKTV